MLSEGSFDTEDWCNGRWLKLCHFTVILIVVIFDNITVFTVCLFDQINATNAPTKKN